jgi:hypothetical protein
VRNQEKKSNIVTEKPSKTSLESRQPGATVVPLIISTDKTLLTQFREKVAYPIYMTIGNIPKDIRRKPSSHAQILIGYIPTTKLEHFSTTASRRRGLANLFHACMANALSPISSLGETGVAMMSGDGVWRRCHPIFGIFVGDYPEQALVTCTYNGRCPKCTVPLGQLGQYESFPPHIQSSVIDFYGMVDSDSRAFHDGCHGAKLKPVYHPFWERLPLVDIFISITPDILHQMLQGMMRHLIEWVIMIFGPTEIDARCKAIPPNHKIMLFTKGISKLSRVTGQEHKKMCSILLGLIVDLPVPGGHDTARLVKSVRALLDFLYLAQYQCHTSESIDQLQDCLAAFHENKEAFVQLGARKGFEIPKLHSLSHYAASIQLFGTTDNYNTEQSERLHIDFAKKAYRASNRKDEFRQMTLWLERQEKIHQHAALVEWKQEHHDETPEARKDIGPPRAPTLCIKMALHPSRKAVSFEVLAEKYGAVGFQDALGDFVALTNSPGASATARAHLSSNTLLTFRSVPVFQNIKFSESGKSGIIDSVKARPEQKDSYGRTIPCRFDTVIVRGSQNTESQGIKG